MKKILLTRPFDFFAFELGERLPDQGIEVGIHPEAGVGDAGNFKNGRQLAVWLGIVPRQHSTGGKATLLGISKRGDTYLRTLMIHGARAVIRGAERKPSANPWLSKLVARRNKNVAAVALANKNARTIWALLAHDRQYEAGYGLAT